MCFHHVSSLAQVLEDQKTEADRWMSWAVCSLQSDRCEGCKAYVKIT